MKRIIGLPFLLFGLAWAVLLLACLTMRLERNLPTDLKQWYDEHRVIMGGLLPNELCPAGKRLVEREYWLRLSPDLQREYIKVFWKLRWNECEAEWKARIAWADKFFYVGGRKGSKTDRGNVLIICGQPMDSQEYPDTRSQSTLNRDDENINGMSYLVWHYMSRGTIVGVWFRYRFGDWKQEPTSAINGSEVYAMFQDALTWWHPWDWDVWGKR